MRLIDADELLEHAYRDKLDTRELIADMINNAPTVKEIPVKIPLDLITKALEQEPKTGKWIKIETGNKDFPESIVCSRCKNENSHLDFDEYCEPIGKVFVTSKYCPNCGAKMESEE